MESTESGTTSQFAQRVRGLVGVIDLTAGEEASAAPLAKALLAGGAGALFLRMKGVPDRVYAETARAVQALCQMRATFLVNDRIDIALAVGADGVHLGTDDLPMQEAKNLMRPNFLIGRTAHDEEQVRRAMKTGADYFALGPVYAPERGEPSPAIGFAAARDVLGWANVPCVLYGGIPLDKVGELAGLKPAALAVVDAVNKAPDVTAAAKQVVQAYYSAHNRS